MSNKSDEEALAEAWLRQQGYAASRPTWLPTGQKNPDFWAENTSLHPPHLWVEVKSIDSDDSVAAMNRFSDLIRKAEIPPGLHGNAVMEFVPHATEQSVRWALQSFLKRSTRYIGKKTSLIFLDQTRSGGQEYQIEIEAETPITVWARTNQFPLNPSTAISDKDLRAATRVKAFDGTEMSGPAYRFFGPEHRMQCVLALQLDPDDSALTSIGYMCGGGGQTRERTVRILERANRQIKTACATHDVPSLVILAPSDPFDDGDRMIQAAIYGQYTIPLQLTKDGVLGGDMYHGHDGVFRRNKNTHISAAVHVRRDGSATFFPNPFSRHVIDDNAPIFSGAARAKIEIV